MQDMRISARTSSIWHLSIALLIAVTFNAYAQENTVTFDNQSGEQALVRLIGPTYQEIAVPTGGKKTVTAAAGRYHIKVQYGTSGKYRYTKGEEFDVTSSSTTSSQIIITLHKVQQGNYETKPINAQEFEKGRAAAVSKQSGSSKVTTDKETRVSIPSNRTGIWVTAITGKGCETPRGPGVVYVLSEKEYVERDRPGKKLEPVGETPILITNVTPGTYFVGVQAIIDEKKVGTKKVGSMGMELPAFDDFFVADMAVTQEGVFRNKPMGANGLFEKLNPWYRKWYKVVVEDKKLKPVVALFLEKQANPKIWAQYYPAEHSFTLPKLQGGENVLWNAFDYEGSEGHVVPIETRGVLQDLLARGGCAPLPHPEVGIVWINQDGGIEAKRRVRADKIVAGVAPATSFAPLSRSPSNEATSGGDVLPRFHQELTKGTNEVRVSNTSDSAVKVGVRSDRRGVDLSVPANGTGSVLVPNGSYNIFFAYANEKNTPYQTDSFDLKQSGVDIQLVRVLGGIYAIWRVR